MKASLSSQEMKRFSQLLPRPLKPQTMQESKKRVEIKYGSFSGSQPRSQRVGLNSVKLMNFYVGNFPRTMVEICFVSSHTKQSKMAANYST